MIENNFETCNYKKCNKDVKYDEKNHSGADGVLYLELQGGYGSFYDSLFDEEGKYIVLCHKHAHKFANFIGNDTAISAYRSTSHSPKMKQSFFHNAWDSHTWGSYLSAIFIALFHHRTIVGAIEITKERFYTHLRWTKNDINDFSSTQNWKAFWKRFFFNNWKIRND